MMVPVEAESGLYELIDNWRWMTHMRSRYRVFCGAAKRVGLQSVWVGSGGEPEGDFARAHAAVGERSARDSRCLSAKREFGNLSEASVTAAARVASEPEGLPPDPTDAPSGVSARTTAARIQSR
ncbi:hypothetical protein RZS08_33765, partial [Arthrospira platensis SPKY1]|nr:hypothetical protein [Arthrospira platensis SPKY1]